MDLSETYLPAGLLRCGHCYEPMVQVDAGIEPGYQCQPGCRPTPLDAARIADTIGRAILRHAPHIVPTTSTPAHPQVAATYADRVLTHVTVGVSGTAITLAWSTTPILLPNPHRSIEVDSVEIDVEPDVRTFDRIRPDYLQTTKGIPIFSEAFVEAAVSRFSFTQRSGRSRRASSWRGTACSGPTWSRRWS